MSPPWTRSANEALATLQDVVAIDSVNPDLPGGSQGEAGMVAYLADFFERAGIPYATHEVLPGRRNLVATLEGRDPDRVLLFECHMDTASVGVMTIPPFEPHIRGGRLYGRGACDTKSGGVAMIHAMKRLKQAGRTPPCTIVYAGAIDEEYRFRGALHLATTLRVEAAVVAEPTELAIVRAHNGLVRFRIRVTGVAAHSSKPHLGRNAIVQMARLICRMEDEIAPTYQTREHPLIGSPTQNVGVISGGAQVNFVPDECVIEVDRRVIPGETPEQALTAFRELIDRACAEDPRLSVEIEPPFLRDAPMETAEDARIVQVAAQAGRDVLGDAVISGVPYGTDASKFAARGVPTIVLGPGSVDQAHTAVEWVETDQVLRAIDIYERIMMDY